MSARVLLVLTVGLVIFHGTTTMRTNERSGELSAPPPWDPLLDMFNEPSSRQVAAKPVHRILHRIPSSGYDQKDENEVDGIYYILEKNLYPPERMDRIEPNLDDAELNDEILNNLITAPYNKHRVTSLMDADDRGLKKNYFANEDKLMKKIIRQKNFMNNDKDDNIKDARTEKRGFSMLARWRPFSQLGRQRNPIRPGYNSKLTPPLIGATGIDGVPADGMGDFDIVSAETRAMLRPVGQPLRWG